jgi:hypothetical protein
MMTKDEALKMAIEALDLANGARIIEGIVLDNSYEINACKEALEQPEGKEFFERGKEIARWADEQPAMTYEQGFAHGYEAHRVEQVLEQPAQEVECSNHPDAPHGFCRDASHSAGRYVCECEGWEVEQPTVAELNDEYLQDTNVMGLEQPAQRNFCERCGKRASKDLYHIHTCTPPQALKEKNHDS